MAITESRIKAIEDRLDELQQSFIQTAKNQVPITAKVDDTANKVVELTPFQETKKAYYGEYTKSFYNVPNGRITVYFDNYDSDYIVRRYSNRVEIEFNTLIKETNITIIIQ